MYFFTALLVATSFLGVCIGQGAEILEHPQAQYVLVGDKTTVYCKTIGQDAFWLINNETISETHLATKRRYESLGFSFGDSDHGMWGYHNLTMNVSASESINSTTIECIVVDHNFHQIESNAAYLYIFTDIRPYTPELAISRMRCQDLSPPVLYGSIRVQPRWTGYDITEFRINITNSSNGVILRQTTIPYRGQKEYHYFNEILPGCVDSLNNSSVLVSTAAFSRTYGESVPSPAIEAKMDRALGNFSEQEISYIVYFYPSGTPFLFLEIKPPSAICSCQKVAYTIETVDINTGQFEALGPFYHTGLKPVTQNLISSMLQRDHNYTVTVTVESSGEISTSKSYLFNTTLNLIPKQCNSNARGDIFFYQLGMSMSLFIAVVITTIPVILMLSMYIYHKREQIFISLAARRAHHSHPIRYDGPVYECIKPASKNTLSTDTKQTEVTSGHAQHSHPDETGMSSSSVFHENDLQYPTVCMTTKKRDEYEDDIILVFDSERKDMLNRQILGKNYSQ